MRDKRRRGSIIGCRNITLRCPFVVRLGVRLPCRSTFITHSPILRMSTLTDPYFPIFVTFGTFGRERRRRRRSARAARQEREGGAGKGEGGPRRRLQGRKAHRLDLIELLYFVFPLSPLILLYNNFLSFSPNYKYNII